MDIGYLEAYSFNNFYSDKNDDNYALLSFLKKLGKEEKKGLVYIYGSSGTGKTHILKAFQNEFKNKTVYFNIDNLIDFITKKSFEVFLSTIKCYDYILIDHIELSENLNIVQKVLVRTINSIIENNKTAIIAGNINPKYISKLNKDNIKNVKEAIIYEVKYPNDNIRMKIIDNSIKNTALESISKEIKEYICDLTNGVDVRKIFGSLNRINVWSNIIKPVESLDEAKKCLKEYYSGKKSDKY